MSNRFRRLLAAAVVALGTAPAAAQDRQPVVASGWFTVEGTNLGVGHPVTFNGADVVFSVVPAGRTLVIEEVSVTAAAYATDSTPPMNARIEVLAERLSGTRWQPRWRRTRLVPGMRFADDSFEFCETSSMRYYAEAPDRIKVWFVLNRKSPTGDPTRVYYTVSGYLE